MNRPCRFELEENSRRKCHVTPCKPGGSSLDGPPIQDWGDRPATKLSHRLFRLSSDPVTSHVTYSSAVRAGLARTGRPTENNLALRANPHLRLTKKRAPLEPTSSVNCYSSQLTCSRKRFRIRSFSQSPCFRGQRDRPCGRPLRLRGESSNPAS